MPAEPESPRPPAGSAHLPARRPAASDPALFASRLTSVPPAGVHTDVRTVAASASRPAASEQEYRDQVGRRVRLARIAQGLAQDELARSAGVTRNFVRVKLG
jgi:ribosome-binding protein aMBF1 (putative translation factor)